MKYKLKSMIILVLIMTALFFVPSGVKASGSQILFTSTADFDAGTKGTDAIPLNFFARNGVSQPINFVSYPSAQTFAGKTYVVYQGADSISDAATPNPYIVVYDNTTGLWAGPYKIADGPLTNDDHGAPAILILPNGNIHVFYGGHSSAEKHSVSNVNDPSTWTAKVGLTSADWTYPTPVYYNGKIYLFIRESSGDDTHTWIDLWTSTNEGDSWTGPSVLIDFGTATGIYKGNVELWADRVWMAWSCVGGGVCPSGSFRENFYAAYYNISSAKMFAKFGGGADVDLGTTIDKTEADTYCLIESTQGGTNHNYGSTQANLGVIHLDYLGRPTVVYDAQVADGSWKYRWSRFLAGTDWIAVTNITSSKAEENRGDFIINPGVDTYKLWLTTGNFDSTGRTGSIERWDYTEIGGWSKTNTVLDAANTRRTMGNPMIVKDNTANGIRVIFAENFVDTYNANVSWQLHLYAVSDFGLVKRTWADPYQKVATNTDNSLVSAGTFKLTPYSKDYFNLTSVDYGNSPFWQYGMFRAGTDLGSENLTSNGDVAGQLNMNFVTGSANTDQFGLISLNPVSGDFDFRIDPIDNKVSTARFQLGFYNEPVVSYLSSATVDGLMYEQFWQSGSGGDRRFTANSVTNGVPTTIGSMTQFTGGNSWPRDMRIVKAGTSLTFYYNSTNADTWVQDETTTFSTSSNLYLSISQGANSARYSQWNVDRLRTITGGPFGYAPVGTWTSPVQTFDGDNVNTIVVNYTGASASAYIDSLSLLSSSGGILYQNTTKITSGTSVTYTIGASDSLYGIDWKVQLRLVGGASSLTVTDITVNLAHTGLSIALNDGPWILGFFTLLTLGLIGAVALRRKRGGHR
jgi:hypothetical protein